MLRAETLTDLRAVMSWEQGLGLSKFEVDGASAWQVLGGRLPWV